MAYLVIAYPDLIPEDLDMVQKFRVDHDSFYHAIVDPHFTFVFPVSGIALETYSAEIRQRLINAPQIDFVIRCATVNKDTFTDSFYTFLVPDDGYSQIVKLHDKLYSGLLAAEHRLDIDFIPHIGIGTSPDRYECKRMADEWNKKDFNIRGRISKLTIIEYKDKTVTDLESIGLC